MSEHNHDKDAIAAVDEMVRDGHNIEDGKCRPDCVLCEIMQLDPEREYQRIKIALAEEQGLNEHQYIISRPHLHTLAKHPLVDEIKYTKRLPIIVEVIIKVEGRTAIVRGLSPLQTTGKPYTERTSEGVKP